MITLRFLQSLYEIKRKKNRNFSSFFNPTTGHSLPFERAAFSMALFLGEHDLLSEARKMESFCWLPRQFPIPSFKELVIEDHPIFKQRKYA